MTTVYLSNKTQIAITGLGVVSPLGHDVESALRAALLGTSGIRRYVAELAPPGAQIERVGGTIEGFDGSRFIDKKYQALYDSSVAFGLGAANEAVRDAQLNNRPELGDRFGCAVGAGLGGAETWHRLLHGAYLTGNADRISGVSAFAVNGNSLTSLLSLAHGLRGPSIGISNACASGATALALAADQIRLGRADRMLAGAHESSMRTWMSYASFAASGGMNTSSEPSRASKPFSHDRAGFVLGEGAGMVVLERLDLARARGARIYGIVAGEAHTNDAHHIVSPEPTGAAWARPMQLALDAAGMDAGDIDLVCAHGSGTIQGDVAETRAIKRIFGTRAKELPVSATKSMHGHAFGAAAILETILAVAAMQSDMVLPTINFKGGDHECNLDYVANQARKHPLRAFIKNSFGAGGVSTALIIKRVVQGVQQ